MTNQLIELETISDNELAAAAGGVSADGQELGKNVTIDGSQNLNIGKLEAKAGDTVTFG